MRQVAVNHQTKGREAFINRRLREAMIIKKRTFQKSFVVA